MVHLLIWIDIDMKVSKRKIERNSNDLSVWQSLRQLIMTYKFIYFLTLFTCHI